MAPAEAPLFCATPQKPHALAFPRRALHQVPSGDPQSNPEGWRKAAENCPLCKRNCPACAMCVQGEAFADLSEALVRNSCACIGPVHSLTALDWPTASPGTASQACGNRQHHGPPQPLRLAGVPVVPSCPPPPASADLITAVNICQTCSSKCGSCPGSGAATQAYTPCASCTACAECCPQWFGLCSACSNCEYCQHCPE